MKLEIVKTPRRHVNRVVRVAIYDRQTTWKSIDLALEVPEVRRRLCPKCHGTGDDTPGASVVFTRYVDCGPGTTNARPGLTRLIAAVMTGHVNVIVCRRPDRLSREAVRFQRLFRAFRRAGVNILFLDRLSHRTRPA